jgi:hypothetical protein
VGSNAIHRGAARFVRAAPRAYRAAREHVLSSIVVLHRICLSLSITAALAGCTPGHGGVGTDEDAGSAPECTSAYALRRRRPEVMLVVDRSCAMRARLDGSGDATGPDDPEGRWSAVRAAVDALTEMPRASGWGLVLYPGDDPTMCTEPRVLVDPAPGSAAEVAGALASEDDPFAVCAGGAAQVQLEGALNAVGLDENLGATGEPFVLVIASGAPGCGSTTDSLLAAEALTTELSTEVVVRALGPDASAAPMLEAIAAAGGAPRPDGPPSYYEASSADAVRTVIDGLLAERESCVLDLVNGPIDPDPEALRVWVDGMAVSPDPDEGWSYSAGDGSLALNGTLCEKLRAGDLQRIEAAVDCDAPTCVPLDETCDSLDDDCDGTVDEDCF